MVYSLFCSRGITALAALGCALLAIGSVAALPLKREAFSSFTTLSTDQIAAFKPFSFYASAGYCQPSATLAWNCGANCNANPSFEPVASGGDGSETQFCKRLLTGSICKKLTSAAQRGFVGFDPTLNTIIVSHQGTDTSEMYVTRARMFLSANSQFDTAFLSSRMLISS